MVHFAKIPIANPLYKSGVYVPTLGEFGGGFGEVLGRFREIFLGGDFGVFFDGFREVLGKLLEGKTLSKTTIKAEKPTNTYNNLNHFFGGELYTLVLK